MHVISEDFNSDKLKNKKHWNSFTTRFFIDADDFISILENEGAISVYSLLFKYYFNIFFNSIIIVIKKAKIIK